MYKNSFLGALLRTPYCQLLTFLSLLSLHASVLFQRLKSETEKP